MCIFNLKNIWKCLENVHLGRIVVCLANVDTLANSSLCSMSCWYCVVTAVAGLPDSPCHNMTHSVV